jgi:hypothetical protein
MLLAEFDAARLPRVHRIQYLALAMPRHTDSDAGTAIWVAAAFSVIGLVGFLALLPS